MSGYVTAGYLVTFGSIVLYSWRTIRRNKALRSYLDRRTDV